jgi:hypothetical protein
VSGDTCHLNLVQPYPKRPNPPATCHLLVMPRVIIRICHVSYSGTATSPVRTCHVSTVRTATWQYGLPSQHQIFACLTFRTERDIFSIRTPFDEVNIPPESGRRDGRNGTGFVAFRALSFLSIFQALSGFWIRFRIIKISCNTIPTTDSILLDI